jgi:hypothetical protein
MNDLRKGKSAVKEWDHTLLIGWTDRSMAFIAPALSVGGSALGMATGAGGLVQAHEMYKGAMAQTKRYFAANWAETSWRHSEALHQAERHNRDATAFNEAFLAQTDKVHLREFRQAELQDKRNYLMTVNAEVREALREIVVAKAYEFNNIMLCDTVCLGVAFTVAVEGVMPPESSRMLIVMYAGFIGAAILFLSASLWLSFILIRRLNLYTAGIMHAMIDMERVKRERDILEEFDPVSSAKTPTIPENPGSLRSIGGLLGVKTSLSRYHSHFGRRRRRSRRAAQGMRRLWRSAGLGEGDGAGAGGSGAGPREVLRWQPGAARRGGARRPAAPRGGAGRGVPGRAGRQERVL